MTTIFNYIMAIDFLKLLSSAKLTIIAAVIIIEILALLEQLLYMKFYGKYEL